jgi:hypothetical protein
MNNKIEKLPNAFVFKAFIDGEIRTCVCPRIDNKWSEADITYIKDDPYKEFDEVLDDKLFSVIFVGYEPDTNGSTGFGFTLKNVNSNYLKSDTSIASEMYNEGSFFSTIEKGYQHFYEFSVTCFRSFIRIVVFFL